MKTNVSCWKNNAWHLTSSNVLYFILLVLTCGVCSCLEHFLCDLFPSQSWNSTTYFYLQAKVLHPLLYGGWDCSLRLFQGLWTLFTTSQQTRVTSNVDGSSCNSHLGGQSRIQDRDNQAIKQSYWTMYTRRHAQLVKKPSVHVTVSLCRRCGCFLTHPAKLAS